MVVVPTGDVLYWLELCMGASVDAADIHGRTALFLACDEGNISQGFGQLARSWSCGTLACTLGGAWHCSCTTGNGSDAHALVGSGTNHVEVNTNSTTHP